MVISKKTIKIGLVIVVLAIIGAGAVMALNNRTGRLVSPVAETNVKKQAVLVVDDGKGSPKTFNVEFNQGDSAFNVLKNALEKSNVVLETKNYDIGVLIESIGGIKNGENEKYWMYYINEKLANIAADKYKINLGDKIEFKFEKSPY